MLAMTGADDSFLQKAQESLDGAQSEYVNNRYNNCANRSYYACFQAAVYALSQAEIRPARDWGHDFVQAQFIGQLINRRKMYSTALRQALIQNYRLREIADYSTDQISETRARRAVRRAEEFVEGIKQGGTRV
jgi:uncharacterized protein (UPF0332 family)